MRVTFPLVKQTGTNLIEYPDTINLFSNVDIINEQVIADYSGALELTEYTSSVLNIAPFKLSRLAFMELIGDANLMILQDLAEFTNPSYDGTIRLFLRKLDAATVIDFDDLDRGPKTGLDYCLAQAYITQVEYDRIMSREFPV